MRRSVVSTACTYGGALILAAAFNGSDQRGQATLLAGFMLFAVSFALLTYLLRIRGAHQG
jgi:hypothetical protein